MAALLSELSEEELREKCESYEVIFTETERFWLDTLNSLNSIIESVPTTSAEQVPSLLNEATTLITSGYNIIEDSRQKLELGRDVYELREELDKIRDEYEANKLEWDATVSENAKYIASLQAELILLRENEKTQPEDWLQKEYEWNAKEREGRVLISDLQRSVQNLQDAQRSWVQERENGLALLRKLQGENQVLRQQSQVYLRGLSQVSQDDDEDTPPAQNGHVNGTIDEYDVDLEDEINELTERHERVSSMVEELTTSNRRLSTQLVRISQEEAALNPNEDEDSVDEEFETIVNKYRVVETQTEEQGQQSMSEEEYFRSQQIISTLRLERSQLLERIQGLEQGMGEVEVGERTKPLHSEMSSYNLSDMEYKKMKDEMMEQLREYNQQQIRALVQRQDELRWKNNSVGRGDIRSIDVTPPDPEPAVVADGRRASVDEQEAKGQEGIKKDENAKSNGRHSHLVRSNTLTEWTDMSLFNLKDQMMGELRNLQKEQLESMFNQQDSLRWNEKTPELKELREELRVEDKRPKVSSRSRQSNLVRNRTKTDWAESDLVALKEELVEELHRIHVTEMERLITTQDELRLPQPKRNTVQDSSSNDLSEAQIAKLRDEMLIQLEIITKRELGNMFDRQQQLRWGNQETKVEEPEPVPIPEGAPPLTPQNTHFMGQETVNITNEYIEDFAGEIEEPQRPDVDGRVSNLYRSGTRTEWKEADLELLKNEMAQQVNGIQKDKMRQMFEERERLYWVAPEEKKQDEQQQLGTIEPRMSREGPSKSIVIHDYGYEEDADQFVELEASAQLVGLDVPQDSVNRGDDEARSPREINVSSVVWNPDDGDAGHFSETMSNPNPHEIVPRGSGSLSAAIRAGRDLFGNKFDNPTPQSLLYQSNPPPAATDKSQDVSAKYEKEMRTLEKRTAELETDLKSAQDELFVRRQELEALKTSKYQLIEATASQIDSLREIIFRQSKHGASTARLR